jgi:hypothetical protein
LSPPFERTSALTAAVLALVLASATGAQTPRIGIIDFYGVRHVDESQLRQALQISVGDSFPGSRKEVERRLESVPGVARARLNGVCCEQGKAILYVGIEERGDTGLTLLPAPHRAVRLPDDVVAAAAMFDTALTSAVTRGDAAEDDSRGYALNHAPALRAIQEKYIAFAARDLPRLRDVLRNSGDADQRAIAAQLIGYAADKREVVGDLVHAMRDSSDVVRNNATRSLFVIAKYAQAHPEAHLRIPPEPFVDLLNSLVWTDRNKSSLALMELSAHRDPALLATLRARALSSLVEMARWKSPGHAQAAFMILGRIAGLSDEEIIKAWTAGDRERVITAALNAQPRP